MSFLRDCVNSLLEDQNSIGNKKLKNYLIHEFGEKVIFSQ